MNREQLAPWIERLQKAEKEDHKAMVEEMAKENKLKPKDAWGLLKEAGFDFDAEPQRDPKTGEKIASWIERLKAAGEGGHEAVIAEIAAEELMKTDGVINLLEISGFAPAVNPPPNHEDDGKKQTVVLRHKTGYPQYRRAGLVMGQLDKSYQVTEAQLAALRKDPWVIVNDGKKDGTGK